MKKSNLRYYIVSLLAVFVIALVGSCEESRHKRESSLIEYSASFARDVLSDRSAELHLDSLRQYVGKNDSIVYAGLAGFAVGMMERSEPGNAYRYLRQAVDMLGEDPKSEVGRKFKARCYLLLGAASDDVGMRSLCMDYNRKGLALCEKYGYEDLKAEFLNNIGVCYTRNSQYDKSREYFERSLALNKWYGDSYNMFVNYSNLSDAEVKSGNLDRALEEALRGIQCLDQDKYPEFYYSMQSVLGNLYTLKNDYPLAQTFLNSAFIHQKRLKSRSDLVETCLYLIDLYDKTDSNDSIAKYAREAQRLITQLGNPDLQDRLLDKEAALAAKEGQYKLAYDLSQRVIVKKDSLYVAENQARLEQAHDMYNAERQAQKRYQGIAGWDPVTVFFTMGGFALVVVGLLVWILLLYSKRKKIVQAKIEADAEVSRMNRERLDDELRKGEENRRNLDQYQRELTTVALEKIREAEQVRDVLQDVRKLESETSSRNSELKNTLRSVIGKLVSLNKEAGWDEFRLYFEKVHPVFYSNLLAKFPDLTAKDRRLCGLISLGLTTKEIATITYREPRSVESSRLRLRKKLGIDSDVSLEDFLKSFS